MKLYGEYELLIEPPGEAPFVYRQENLITVVGKTAIGDLLLDQGTHSPITHICFGSGVGALTYLNVALSSEKWAIDCTVAGDRVTEIIDSNVGLAITVKKTAAQTYGGATFSMTEMGVFGRKGGLTAVMFSRALAVSPVTIANGTQMIPSWTLRFREETT